MGDNSAARETDHPTIMTRYFNTAGPCDPARHYMLPPERRLPEVGTLIERALYFVLHAPRQTGKTTSIRTLARRLTEEGRYTAVVSSCEGGQTVGVDLEKGITAVLEALTQAARNDLPESLWPPVPDLSVSAATRLHDLLARWAVGSPRPVVLFLDGADTLRDEVLLSVLRQIRAGYHVRSKGFPHSVALIGMRDVGRVRLSFPVDGFATSSFFNIASSSLTLRNLTEEEIDELYGHHTEETGQIFQPDAVRRCFELSQGQPWLVNALAAEIVDSLVTERGTAIERFHIEVAKERLVLRRYDHLSFLIERSREKRVQRIVEPILARELLSPDLMEDEVRLVIDLGLVRPGPEGFEIANPIYHEVITHPKNLRFSSNDERGLPRGWSREFLEMAGSAPDFPYPDEPSPALDQEAEPGSADR
jgi:hypothetical protein